MVARVFFFFIRYAPSLSFSTENIKKIFMLLRKILRQPCFAICSEGKSREYVSIWKIPRIFTRQRRDMIFLLRGKIISVRDFSFFFNFLFRLFLSYFLLRENTIATTTSSYPATRYLTFDVPFDIPPSIYAAAEFLPCDARSTLTMKYRTVLHYRITPATSEIPILSRTYVCREKKNKIKKSRLKTLSR